MEEVEDGRGVERAGEEDAGQTVEGGEDPGDLRASVTIQQARCKCLRSAEKPGEGREDMIRR